MNEYRKKQQSQNGKDDKDDKKPAVNPKDHFELFLKTFEDKIGHYPYRNKIYEMINNDEVSLRVDFRHLAIFDDEYATQFLNNPDLYLNGANTALEAVLRLTDREYYQKYRPFFVRFTDLPPSNKFQVNKLRIDQLSSLIELFGIFIRRSEVKPKLINAVFECKLCGSLVSVEQNDPSNRLLQPVQCMDANCNSKGPFALDDLQSTFTDYQEIIIQEAPDALAGSQSPRQLLCVTMDDELDMVLPGQRGSIIGTLRLRPEFARGSQKDIFNTYLDVNSIVVADRDLDDLLPTTDELRQFDELRQDPDVHNKIIDSICPAITGCRDIKLAIALALFSGEDRIMKDGTKLRGTSNVLLIGDPGTGKTRLLKFAAEVAPRGLYTSGRGISAAGLTAGLVKDEKGRLSLEAGVLPMVDRGLAAIDELDKMDKRDTSGFHEQMESHTISIAKAGVIATLNARTAIVGGANPIGGRIDESIAIGENIKLKPTILSRFDLVFILKDTVNPDSDHDKAMHVLKLHEREDLPIKPPLSPILLKKYIRYTRSFNPKLTRRISDILHDFYQEMRKASKYSSMPITIRQLEASIRLAKNYARMALRPKVTESDARIIIHLMRNAFEIFKDRNTGEFNFSDLYMGRSATSLTAQGEILRIFGKYYRKDPKYKAKGLKFTTIKKEADKLMIKEKDFINAMSFLRKDGVLLQLGTGNYKLGTV